MTKQKGYVDVDYLKLAAELTRPAKEGSYKRLDIQPGQRVLDVGCGPGTDTLALARLLGPEGRVVGVDFDAGMIAIADQRAEVAGFGHQVRHRVGDALSLPFEEDEFDATRSERLFEHLLQPERALSEMVRVTRPGGRVVVLDTDWGTQSFDSALPDLERRLARVHAEHGLNNGYSGRQLRRLFLRQGLQDVTLACFPLFTVHYGFARMIASLDQVEADAVRLGIASEAEIATWRAGLEAADAEGVFFASLNMVLASGKKMGWSEGAKDHATLK
jgi:SAM-dependent methyltransferase